MLEIYELLAFGECVSTLMLPTLLLPQVPKTVSNGHIEVDTTKDNEVIALKNRVAAIENHLKKLSESYEMNQL